MKHLYCALLAAALVAMFAGCADEQAASVKPEATMAASASPSPSPSPTPDPLEAEIDEAMKLFDDTAGRVQELNSAGSRGDEGAVDAGYALEASEALLKSMEGFVNHMIGKGYEFLRKFQPRLLEKYGSDESAVQTYYLLSYRIQTGDYDMRIGGALDPYAGVDEYYGEEEVLRGRNADLVLDKLTPCDAETDKAVFGFFYGEWSLMSEAGAEYMISNGLTGMVDESLEALRLKQDSLYFSDEPNKLVTALAAFEKAGTPECVATISQFEQDMASGAYTDAAFEECALGLKLEGLENAPEVRKKLEQSSGVISLATVKNSPRLMAAFQSMPLEYKSQSIVVNSGELPEDFKAADPQKGRYFLIFDPSPDRADSLGADIFDSLELTLKSGEKLRSVNNPNEAQILVYAVLSYKYHTTYYSTTGNSSLQIYRGKLSLTAKDALTGKKLASTDISAKIQSTYTANPGSMYVRSFPDSSIEKFAKKLVTAAEKNWVSEEDRDEE